MSALLIALQFGLGLILLTTGIGKLLDVQGFISIIDTYQVSPGWMQPPLAVLIVGSELKIAESLLRGNGVRAAAIASAILHAFFSIVALTTLLRGIAVSNCGCFGVFMGRPLTWQTLFEDICLLLASIALVLLSNRHGATVNPENAN